MKKFIPLILFVFIANFCFGQITEKQLKLVNFISIDTVVYDNMGAPISITVPANKIWKVVNIISNTSVYLNSLMNQPAINLAPVYQNNTLLQNYNGVPIWLKEGEQIWLYNGSGNRCKISAFEFVLE